MSNKPLEAQSGDPKDGADGKTRLLLAAEELFARSGIDGASLREIAAKAGQGNHFAVQYHFGGRDGLVRALYDYRMLQMETRRQRMLADAEATGNLDDAKTLMEILFLPQLELQDADGKHSYAGFLSQVLLRNSGSDFTSEFGAFGTVLPPNLARTQALVQQRLSFLPVETLRRRLFGACLMFLNILVVHHGRDEADESLEAALDDTLDQIVVGLLMPARIDKVSSSFVGRAAAVEAE